MLIQGTNAPIVIEFDDDTSSILDISVALVKDNEILIKWEKTNITLDGVFAYCPLSQEDTMKLTPNFAVLEVKWTNADGEVHFAEPTLVEIVKRVDSTILVEV